MRRTIPYVEKRLKRRRPSGLIHNVEVRASSVQLSCEKYFHLRVWSYEGTKTLDFVHMDGLPISDFTKLKSARLRHGERVRWGFIFEWIEHSVLCLQRSLLNCKNRRRAGKHLVAKVPVLEQLIRIVKSWGRMTLNWKTMDQNPRKELKKQLPCRKKQNKTFYYREIHRKTVLCSRKSFRRTPEIENNVMQYGITDIHFVKQRLRYEFSRKKHLVLFLMQKSVLWTWLSVELIAVVFVWECLYEPKSASQYFTICWTFLKCYKSRLGWRSARVCTFEKI